MSRRIKDWFKSLVLEHVIIEVKPTPVNFDSAAIGRILALDVVAAMSPALVGALNMAIIESKKPPEPVTRGPQPLSDVPVDPSLEGDLLAKLPPDVQEACRYGCRKVQSDPSHPAGGRTLGNNWHRDEACEWAKIWLRDRALEYRDTDIHVGCELYYRIYIKSHKPN